VKAVVGQELNREHSLPHVLLVKVLAKSECNKGSSPFHKPADSAEDPEKSSQILVANVEVTGGLKRPRHYL